MIRQKHVSWDTRFCLLTEKLSQFLSPGRIMYLRSKLNNTRQNSCQPQVSLGQFFCYWLSKLGFFFTTTASDNKLVWWNRQHQEQENILSAYFITKCHIINNIKTWFTRLNHSHFDFQQFEINVKLKAPVFNFHRNTSSPSTVCVGLASARILVGSVMFHAAWGRFGRKQSSSLDLNDYQNSSFTSYTITSSDYIILKCVY